MDFDAGRFLAEYAAASNARNRKWLGDMMLCFPKRASVLPARKSG